MDHKSGVFVLNLCLARGSRAVSEGEIDKQLDKDPCTPQNGKFEGWKLQIFYSYKDSKRDFKLELLFLKSSFNLMQTQHFGEVKITNL